MSILANHQSVVVGVDGSERAMKAAVWAAAVANRRNAPLVLVNVLADTIYPYSEGAMMFPGDFEETVRKDSEAILDRAERIVREQFPDVRLTRSTPQGAAGTSLVNLSEHASMVVAGATGAGAVKSLITGSTVMRVVNHAHCPVTVFRTGVAGAVPDHRPVVVGVDGSELSALAIKSAVDFAVLFDVPLLAVHAWGTGELAGRDSTLKTVNRPIVEQEQAALTAGSLAGWRAEFPDLRITTIIEQERPAELILAHAHDAQLIVVGNRGHNRLVGSLLGSTSQNLISHAECAVMVCRSGT